MGKEVKKCVIISGAPEEDINYIKKYLYDSFIICADSGYLKCVKLGIKPDLIVGDFDSAPVADIPCEIVKLEVRKNDTDTFHCVKIAVQKGFDEIVILSGIGSRFDHTYSNVLSLAYCIDKKVKACLINSKNKIFIVDSPVTLESNGYKYFSLFALFENVDNLTIKGAEYDLDNYNLEPFDQLTQSNSFKGENVSISFIKGKLLIILCND